jgi:hypothetical protein
MAVLWKSSPETACVEDPCFAFLDRSYDPGLISHTTWVAFINSFETEKRRIGSSAT